MSGIIRTLSIPLPVDVYYAHFWCFHSSLFSPSEILCISNCSLFFQYFITSISHLIENSVNNYFSGCMIVCKWQAHNLFEHFCFIIIIIIYFLGSTVFELGLELTRQALSTTWATLSVLFCFSYFSDSIFHMLFVWKEPHTMILLPVSPAQLGLLATMSDLLVEMWVLLSFCPGCPWTIVLLISASA
jgi:hypothetical protein